MTRFATLALTPALVLTAASTSAATVTLTPDLVNLGDTNTTVFDDGNVVLTPLDAGSPTTFNANAARLGIDNAGTVNANAFNGTDEQLRLAFSSNAGLTQLGYDFTSSTLGTGGQFVISGFIADPLATFSGNLTAVTVGVSGPSAVYDAGAGTLTVNTTVFENDDTFLDLANAAASAGQTLLITPQGQLPITTISYNDAVPEPGSLALLGLGGLLIARRRRD